MKLDGKDKSDLLYNIERQLTEQNRRNNSECAVKDETDNRDGSNRLKYYIYSKGKPLKENFEIESENEVDGDCKGPEL